MRHCRHPHLGLAPRSRRIAALAAIAFLLGLALAGCGRRAAPVAPPRDLNEPPTAAVTVTGDCAGLPVLLDAGDSEDLDGTIALYEWDFDNDGLIDAGGPALVQVIRSYPPGQHRVKLVVTDNAGAYDVGIFQFTLDAPETTYVSSTTGSPGGNGTRASPFSTVGAALAGVPATGCAGVVLVALGDYPEAIDIPSNVALRGGYDPTTWQRIPGERTEIWVGAQPATASEVTSSEVSDFRFVAADVTIPSTSSIAMLVTNSNHLRFVRCRFVAGNGQFGGDGTPGASGFQGQDGPDASGSTGGFWVPISAGVGGPNGAQPGLAASAGFEGTPSFGCAIGGPGGPAGISVCNGTGTPVGGGPGGRGQDGVDGINGSGLTTVGDFNGTQWVPKRGDNGSYGCRGSGGGSGGAGGSSCAQAGGGGGAGAQPGTEGLGGFGGNGGGASIAVVIFNSPMVVFETCELVSANGGAGGSGGDGGAGASGGLGGAGGTGAVASPGGRGGDGGNGGDGGGGQGGPGGPSWCLWASGSNVSLTAPVFTVGNGGAGGLGGRLGGTGARAASGPPGPASATGS